MSLIATLYTCLIVWSVYNHYYVLSVILIVLFIIVLLIKQYRKQELIKYYEAQIKQAQELHIKNIFFEPFININIVPWYVIDLIPGISREVAKKIYNYTKRKRHFENFIEFANFCGFDLQFYSIIRKIIKFQ